MVSSGVGGALAASRAASRRAWRRRLARRQPLAVAAALAAIVAVFATSVSRGQLAAAAAEARSGSTEPSDDLAIIGAGVLGRLVASDWGSGHTKAKIIGVTLTETSHDELRKLGLEPMTAASLEKMEPRPHFSHMVFSAPPRRSEGAANEASYADDVAKALSFWSSNGQGGFVFTSSIGVYAEDDGGDVTEESPLSASPRIQGIVEAEKLVLAAGGTVLRLAGLYDVQRGAHSFWLKAGVVRGKPDGVLNLVHYKDAASAVVAALERGKDVRGKVFIVADGSPITRSEICEAAVSAAPFRGSKAPQFEVPKSAGDGKRLDGARAREALGWTPRYPSFGQFMAKL
mmetsp:Transcript_20612/g.45119  ORF Transcript_20612/g.45119 Transcript_20612/m.45119 type:complete len:344 (-) Transcript_20612:27-1058(-)